MALATPTKFEDPFPEADIIDPPFRDYLDRWRGLGEGAPPHLRHIDPSDFKTLLPGTVLFEVTEGPRFRYRVAGEELKEIIGHRLIGFDLEEVIPRSPYFDYVVEHLARSCETGRPGYSEHVYRDRRIGLGRKIRRIDFPFAGDDGGVARLLLLHAIEQDFEPLPSTGSILDEITSIRRGYLAAA